jgi:hypothetical protein
MIVTRETFTYEEYTAESDSSLKKIEFLRKDEEHLVNPVVSFQ